MSFKLFNREKKYDNIIVQIPTIATDETELGYAGYHWYKAAYAHEVATALFDKLGNQNTEIGTLKAKITEQDKIITSLKAELGWYLRDKEVEP